MISSSTYQNVQTDSDEEPKISGCGVLNAMFSVVGSFLGILTLSGLNSFLDGIYGNRWWTIGSFGAQAVLIFAAPTAPFSQPWNCFVGNIAGAFVGVTIRILVPDPKYLSVALAVSITIGLQHLTYSLHPPGGATAFIAVIAKDGMEKIGYLFIILALAGSVVHVLVAIFTNAVAKCVGVPKRTYPTFIIPDEIKTLLRC